MKRPLAMSTIFLSVGILFAYYFKTMWLLYLFVGLITIGFLYKEKLKDNKNKIIYLICVISFLFGSLRVTYIEKSTSEKFNQFNGNEVIAIGMVNSEPDIKNTRICYDFKVEKIVYNKKTFKIDKKIQLFVPRKNTLKIYNYGEILKVQGTITLPKTNSNPDGFNCKLFMAQKKLNAQIFVAPYDIYQLSNGGGNALVQLGYNVKIKIVNLINNNFPQNQANLLNGVLIGYTGNFSKDDKNAFSLAGLSHIMAVSGANVLFLVFPLIFLFKKLKIREIYYNIIIILCLIFFVLITGFQPSVMRAVLMATIMLLAKIFRRENDFFTSISFAGLILLIFNPYTLFDIGFQLSFGATLSVVLFYTFINNVISVKWLPKFINEAFVGTIAAQIGVLPITLYYFNTFSLISVVTNILVVPMTGILTVVGMLFVILGGISVLIAKIFAPIILILTTFILLVVKYSSQMEFFIVTLATPSLLIILIYYFLSIYYLYLKPNNLVNFNLKLKHVIPIIATVFISINILNYINKQNEVIFLDVGEGDSALINTIDGKTALIDGGGLSSEGTKGDLVVVPYLLDKGITKLDAVISTHADADHVAGLYAVIKMLEVKNLIIPKLPDNLAYNDLLKLAKVEGVEVNSVSEGSLLKLGNKVKINFLNPQNEIIDNQDKSNDLSLVFKVNIDNNSILFTGDAGKNVEEILINENLDLKADVLKVGHHGSKNSSSEKFLQIVNPKIAIISVGKNNFGHPSEEVLSIFNKLKIKFLRTDIDGAVTIKSKENKLSVHSESNFISN